MGSAGEGVGEGAELRPARVVPVVVRPPLVGEAGVLHLERLEGDLGEDAFVARQRGQHPQGAVFEEAVALGVLDAVQLVDRDHASGVVPVRREDLVFLLQLAVSAAHQAIAGFERRSLLRHGRFPRRGGLVAREEREHFPAGVQRPA